MDPDNFNNNSSQLHVLLRGLVHFYVCATGLRGTNVYTTNACWNLNLLQSSLNAQNYANYVDSNSGRLHILIFIFEKNHRTETLNSMN